MKRRLLLLLTLALALGCLGMGKRPSKHIVSFHMQTDSQFAGSKRVFEWPAGTGNYYEKSPVIHYRQIQSFAPFDGDDGGWGAVFRLTTAGRNALQSVSQSHYGKYMLSIVAGEPRSVTRVGQYVDDGQIVIWEKLKPEDMAMFEKKFSQFQ